MFCLGFVLISEPRAVCHMALQPNQQSCFFKKSFLEVPLVIGTPPLLQWCCLSLLGLSALLFPFCSCPARTCQGTSPLATSCGLAPKVLLLLVIGAIAFCLLSHLDPLPVPIAPSQTTLTFAPNLIGGGVVFFSLLLLYASHVIFNTRILLANSLF